MVCVESAERRRWLGQFVGQFFGERWSCAGNDREVGLVFPGLTPGIPRIDVIIKCHIYPTRRAAVELSLPVMWPKNGRMTSNLGTLILRNQGPGCALQFFEKETQNFSAATWT